VHDAARFNFSEVIHVQTSTTTRLSREESAHTEVNTPRLERRKASFER
jgi:hypothetical protein